MNQINHRKIIAGISFFSVLMFALAFYLILPCHPEHQYTCDGVFGESVSQPLGLNALALFVVSVSLLFFSKEVLKTWAMFSVFYFAIAIMLIISTPVGQTGALGLNPDRSMVSLATSVGFVVISLVVIISKHIYLRTKRNKPFIVK